MDANEAVALSQAVRKVEEALENKFLIWKKRALENKVSPEILEAMESTHKMVLGYIYGALGGDITKVITETIKKQG
jgi:hypothetical protein